MASCAPAPSPHCGWEAFLKAREISTGGFPLGMGQLPRTSGGVPGEAWPPPPTVSSSGPVVALTLQLRGDCPPHTPGVRGLRSAPGPPGTCPWQQKPRRYYLVEARAWGSGACSGHPGEWLFHCSCRYLIPRTGTQAEGFNRKMIPSCTRWTQAHVQPGRVATAQATLPIKRGPQLGPGSCDLHPKLAQFGSVPGSSVCLLLLREAAVRPSGCCPGASWLPGAQALG